MLTTAVLIILLILTCLGLGALAHYRYTRKESLRLKKSLQSHAQKAEELSKNYDHYRRKYLDLDDRFQEVKNMEQTYRVAYLEWKNKYDELEERSCARPEKNLTAVDKREEVLLYSHWKKRAQEAENLLPELTEKVAYLKHRNEAIEEVVRKTESDMQQVANIKKSLLELYQQLEATENSAHLSSGSPGIFDLESD